MNRLILSEAKDVVARAVKRCSTDADVVSYLNEAQQRLLNRPGQPVGSTMRYRFCTDDQCIVLPRQIRTVIKGAWCDHPARVLPEWYDFDPSGWGQLDGSCFMGEAIVDRGTDCKFNDITYGMTDRKFKITTDVAEASGTYIWLYGYDENGQWIRTNIGGTYYDGERYDLGSGVAGYTTNYFTSLVRVKKDTTKGIVRLYEYDTTNAEVSKSTAQYEPSENNPIYRRVMLPFVDDYCTCSTDSSVTTRPVTLFVKLQHIPVSQDNDAFVIGNLSALKLMAMSIQAEEEQRYDDAMKLEMKAQMEIDGELAAYIGPGMELAPQFEPDFGGGGVENVI